MMTNVSFIDTEHRIECGVRIEKRLAEEGTSYLSITKFLPSQLIISRGVEQTPTSTPIILSQGWESLWQRQLANCCMWGCTTNSAQLVHRVPKST